MKAFSRIAVLWMVGAFLIPGVRAQDSKPPVAPAPERELPDAPKKKLYVFDNHGPLPSAIYKGPLPANGFRQKADDWEPQFSFQQVADKKFWFAGVVAPSIASAFDGYATMRAVSMGNTEVNPLFGTHPGVGRIAGIKIGFTALNSICVYILKKKEMRSRYNGVITEGPRWWHLAMVTPALWLSAGAYDYSLGHYHAHP